MVGIGSGRRARQLAPGPCSVILREDPCPEEPGFAAPADLVCGADGLCAGLQAAGRAGRAGPGGAWSEV